MSACLSACLGFSVSSLTFFPSVFSAVAECLGLSVSSLPSFSFFPAVFPLFSRGCLHTLYAAGHWSPTPLPSTCDS
jgi:hypothetical protein